MRLCVGAGLSEYSLPTDVIRTKIPYAVPYLRMTYVNRLCNNIISVIIQISIPVSTVISECLVQFRQIPQKLPAFQKKYLYLTIFRKISQYLLPFRIISWHVLPSRQIPG